MEKWLGIVVIIVAVIYVLNHVKFLKKTVMS